MFWTHVSHKSLEFTIAYSWSSDSISSIGAITSMYDYSQQIWGLEKSWVDKVIIDSFLQLNIKRILHNIENSTRY